ncbi:hypothetical protein [Helicobacter sp. T3_23-1056]
MKKTILTLLLALAKLKAGYTFGLIAPEELPYMSNVCKGFLYGGERGYSIHYELASIKRVKEELKKYAMSYCLKVDLDKIFVQATKEAPRMALQGREITTDLQNETADLNFLCTSLVNEGKQLNIDGALKELKSYIDESYEKNRFFMTATGLARKKELRKTMSGLTPEQVKQCLKIYESSEFDEAMENIARKYGRYPLGK